MLIEQDNWAFFFFVQNICVACISICVCMNVHVWDLLYVLSGVYARMYLSICMLKVDMSCLHRSFPTWLTTAGSLTKLVPSFSFLMCGGELTALKTLTNWGKCRKHLWKYFTEFPFPSQHVETLVDCSTASQPSQAYGLDSCVVSFFTWLPAQFKCYTYPGTSLELSRARALWVLRANTWHVEHMALPAGVEGRQPHKRQTMKPRTCCHSL